ncbi:MAG: thiamine-monophosphate kinase [Myxococcota bacterium]
MSADGDRLDVQTTVEDRLIRRVLASAPVALPLRVQPGDDAVVLSDGTAITVDAMVEGVHFAAETPAEAVGWKVLAISVSDLAAMGARPSWALLALSLPDGDGAWSEGFARGFAEAARTFSISLIGGDTTGSPSLRVVSVTLGGRAASPPLTRAGARPGDRVWVTGTLGLAGLGWCTTTPPPEALDALHRPVPPLELALDLAEQGLATAAMDLSDGLAADLPRLCRASRVGAQILPASLPAAPVVADHPDRLALQVGGGEDYQLLFTAPEAHDGAVEALARHHGVRVTAIGHCTANRAVELVGQCWPAALFTHFGRAS